MALFGKKKKQSPREFDPYPKQVVTGEAYVTNVRFMSPWGPNGQMVTTQEHILFSFRHITEDEIKDLEVYREAIKKDEKVHIEKDEYHCDLRSLRTIVLKA